MLMNISSAGVPVISLQHRCCVVWGMCGLYTWKRVALVVSRMRMMHVVKTKRMPLCIHDTASATLPTLRMVVLMGAVCLQGLHGVLPTCAWHSCVKSCMLGWL
jgi:hypothetical protein